MHVVQFTQQISYDRLRLKHNNMKTAVDILNSVQILLQAGRPGGREFESQ
jgi:hypothetical protein